MKVNFLIGGTEPAGTNQLYYLLKSHKDIYLPDSPQPEPNFFSKDSRYNQGADYYHDAFLSTFNNEKIAGEKSGRYLWHPKAAKRIHQYNPDVKIVFVLRDPVYRAYSNYRFNCLNGIEMYSFEKALEKEDNRFKSMEDDLFWRDIQPFAYFDKGLYAKQLRRFFQLFDKKNIYVTRNDTFSTDPLKEVLGILDFLGLSPEGYELPGNPPTYPSFHVRNLFFQKMIRTINTSFLEKTLMVYRTEGKASVMQKIVQLNLSHKRPQVPEKIIANLRNQFKNEMEELQQMINFGISDWIG